MSVDRLGVESERKQFSGGVGMRTNHVNVQVRTDTCPYYDFLSPSRCHRAGFNTCLTTPAKVGVLLRLHLQHHLRTVRVLNRLLIDVLLKCVVQSTKQQARMEEIERENSQHDHSPVEHGCDAYDTYQHHCIYMSQHGN